MDVLLFLSVIPAENWTLSTAHDQPFRQSEYDQIAKALVAYNGAGGIITQAWVDYLIRTAPNAGILNDRGTPQPKRGRYSIKIRRDANLPRRSYALEWRQATAAEAQNYTNLAVNDYICYWYNEDDWYGTDTTFGNAYSVILAGITGLNDPRVIHCDNGEALMPVPPVPTP